ATGNPNYKAFLEASPHYLETPKGNQATDGDIFWQYTAPLGTISLAVVPHTLGEGVTLKARQAIIHTANQYVGQMKNEGYHIP
ncbi:glycoside hydrolase family 9 protein, partial [Vibrio astriarenae]